MRVGSELKYMVFDSNLTRAPYPQEAILDPDGEAAELALELVGHLVVRGVGGRARVGPDVEGLVEGDAVAHGLPHAARAHRRSIHKERSGTACALGGRRVGAESGVRSRNGRKDVVLSGAKRHACSGSSSSLYTHTTTCTLADAAVVVELHAQLVVAGRHLAVGHDVEALNIHVVVVVPVRGVGKR